MKFDVNEENYPKKQSDKQNYLEKLQWNKLIELTGLNRESIECWKQDYAFNARHSNHISITNNQREEIFLSTWKVVDKLLESLKKIDSSNENPNVSS